MGIKSGFAAVAGARLYYEVAGSGKALVLVHGWYLDSRMWDDQLDVFAEHYQVVRYDIRGFGRSSPPSGEPYSHVDDLKALLDYLNISRAAILGLSMGGAIVVSFAIKYPGSVRSLILADALVGGHPMSLEFLGPFARVQEAARQLGVAAGREAVLAHPVFSVSRERPAVAERLTEMVSDYSGWHWLNADPSRSAQRSAVEGLGKIAVPTLIVVGERDVPDLWIVANTLAKGIPDARLAVLSGLGHMVNMEDPERFNSLVESYLEEVGGDTD